MKIELEIPKYTPEQIADMFWNMDADEMARFFGSVGALALAEKHGYFSLYSQICAATESPRLTPNGARVMEIIGEYVDGKQMQPLK